MNSVVFPSRCLEGCHREGGSLLDAIPGQSTSSSIAPPVGYDEWFRKGRILNEDYRWSDDIECRDRSAVVPNFSSLCISS
jgi:hypothetical protein